MNLSKSYWWLFVPLIIGLSGVVGIFGFKYWQLKQIPVVSVQPSPSPSLAIGESTDIRISECYQKTQCVGAMPCMANPAAYFCTCMGGQVQESNCVINGETHEEWQYFRQTTNMITAAELNQGWYWGDETQAKINTPADWVFSEAGKSSCWHAPETACN